MLTGFLVSKSHPRERGSALIIALILMAVLSALAASLVFVTQIEVSSASTYRQTTQARYVAESGAQAAVDWLKNNLPAPDTTKLDLTKYPATLKNGTCSSSDTSGCVVLSAGLGSGTYSSVDSTAAASFSNFFNSSSNGNQITDMPGGNYNVQAQMMNVKVFKLLGGGTSLVHSWKITSQGNVSGIHNAQAQVSLTVENFPSPIFSYGAFGNSSACSAISMGSLAGTDSYDSSQGPWNASTNHSDTQGNVGSNGSVSLLGAVIHGNDAYANVGGTCSAPSGPNAGNVIQISQLSLPSVPTPTGLGAAVPCGGTCSTLTPGTHYGNIALSGTQLLTLGSGTYYLDGLSVSNQAQIHVSPPGSAIVMYILGSSGPVIAGNGISNIGTGDAPVNFQILYGGGGSSSIVGNGTAQVVFYAPNSDVIVTGSAGLMGALYGNTVSINGASTLHYDRQIANSLNISGPMMATAFSWDRY
ncbi:MAG TPA: PilX N-terminal domain-containing pilus assembly protein [Terriglobales bacterium]|nr:PilX N-terminal domain-containing pilus assembly protein [Terriglobales bacterium]